MTSRKPASRSASGFDMLAGFEQDGFRSVANAYQSWCDGVTACNAEAARFVGKRLAKDFDVPHQLIACQTPTDVLEVQASFVRTMISDYSEEAQRMSELTTRVIAQGMELPTTDRSDK